LKVVMIMISLKNKEWKAFRVKDIFETVSRGKRLKTADHVQGNIPYVSSTAMNNGVDRFIGNVTGVRMYSDCLSLANSGSVGSCFYEPFPFIASDHITHLKNDNLTKYQYLFIAAVLNRLSEKYNFNREINDTRISREVVLLPVNESGQPDYEFMELYMRDKERTRIQEQIIQIKKRLKELGTSKEIESPSAKKQRPISIGTLFTISRPKARNKDDYQDGNIPFVASGAENNGVMKLVQKMGNESYDERNVITVSPVDGSAFYQPIHFLGRGGAGSSILILKNEHLNQYRGQYIAKMISVACSSFSYGRMGNSQIIKKKRIMLPVNDRGDPDYEYMEQYVKNLLIKQYRQYLEYLEARR